jgi:GNAT superfamily N-acetyltransferase
MEIRLFEDKDLRPVLDLYNQNSEFDQLTEQLLKEKLYGDPAFQRESTHVTEENNKIVGFMQGVQREIRGEKFGFIKLMVVNQNHRRQGIARGMYQKLEDYFKENNVKKVRIYDVTGNYWMPGIDPRYTAALCFAWHMGFERFVDTCNLRVDLQNQDWSSKIKDTRLKIKGKEIVIKRAERSDKEALLRFIEKEFTIWRTEVETAFKSNPIAIHIAVVDAEVKAFSAHNSNNIGTGWFGPMGTDPELRGAGIGEILLKRCLQDMKEMGLKYSIIPWVGPIGFYAHHANAAVDRVFWRFEKILT